MLLKTKTGPTAAERMRAQASYAIRETMLRVAGDTPLLLEVVARGPEEWRRNFLRSCRGLPVDEAIAGRLFAFFSDRVVHQFGHAYNANQLLDAMEISVERPPSQREIDESWEVESASSEAGRRYFYGSNRPEDIIRQLTVH